MPYPAEEGNICPCCGTEFGYDDALGVTFRTLRDQWVANETPWFSPIDQPPPLWNGVVQLILADYEFTWTDDFVVEEPQDFDVPGTRISGRVRLAA